MLSPSSVGHVIHQNTKYRARMPLYVTKAHCGRNLEVPRSLGSRWSSPWNAAADREENASTLPIKRWHAPRLQPAQHCLVAVLRHSQRRLSTRLVKQTQSCHAEQANKCQDLSRLEGCSGNTIDQDSHKLLNQLTKCTSPGAMTARWRLMDKSAADSRFQPTSPDPGRPAQQSMR